jgi:hypothetical protein
MIAIIDAAFPKDLDTVRALFREYASGLEVDLDFQDFDAEVAALPGKYARPGGRLLLAKDEIACWVASACGRCPRTIAK